MGVWYIGMLMKIRGWNMKELCLTIRIFLICVQLIIVAVWHKKCTPTLLSGFHLEFFRWGGKLQRKPSPLSLFFRARAQGGTPLTAHSYTKKEGLGMRLLQSLVSFGVPTQLCLHSHLHSWHANFRGGGSFPCTSPSLDETLTMFGTC